MKLILIYEDAEIRLRVSMSGGDTAANRAKLEAKMAKEKARANRRHCVPCTNGTSRYSQE